LEFKDFGGGDAWSLRDQNGALVLRDEDLNEDFFIWTKDQFQRFRYSGLGGNIMLINKARGNELTPNAINNLDRVEERYHRGHDGSGYGPAVLTISEATEDWATGAHGGAYEINTVDNGTTALKQKIYIDTIGTTLRDNTIIEDSLKVGGALAIVADASAILELESTAKGFLLPRMTTAQRDAIVNPATGLEIYDTDTNEVQYWNASEWVRPTQSGVDFIGAPTFVDRVPLFASINGGQIKGSNMSFDLDEIFVDQGFRFNGGPRFCSMSYTIFNASSTTIIDNGAPPFIYNPLEPFPVNSINWVDKILRVTCSGTLSTNNGGNKDLRIFSELFNRQLSTIHNEKLQSI
jgi:hypothetical protein